jgi:hypothetical protein
VDVVAVRNELVVDIFGSNAAGRVPDSMTAMDDSNG